jgi:SAM-dependent methyltransferase
MIKAWPSPFTREELMQWKNDNRHRWDSREQYIIEEPGNPESGPDPSHKNRYLLARNVKDEFERASKTEAMSAVIFADVPYEKAQPIRVLDAACGVGYGGLIMQPEFYRGIDMPPKEGEEESFTVGYANRFAVPWIDGDAKVTGHDLRTDLPFANSFFDIVVSFETIEHVNQKDGLKLMREVWRVLKPGGIWLVSNPLRGAKKEITSVYHLYEREFSELLMDLMQANYKMEGAWMQTVQEPQLVPENNWANPSREQSDKEKIYYVVMRVRKPR